MSRLPEDCTFGESVIPLTIELSSERYSDDVLRYGVGKEGYSIIGQNEIKISLTTAWKKGIFEKLPVL